MNTYEKCKLFIESNKDKIMIVGGLVLIFIVGFGAGDFVKNKTVGQNQTPQYYTTNTTKKPVINNNNNNVEQTESATENFPFTKATATRPSPVPTSASSAGSCIVKASQNSKIYHTKGDTWYKRLKNYTCFSSEAAAEAAGYSKSKR